MSVAIRMIDDLALNHLLSPLLQALTQYVRLNFAFLLREGLPTTAAGAHQVDCSKTMQMMSKLIPDMCRVYLLHLPRFYAVTISLEEFRRRVWMCYASVAVLIRPVTEALRLRTLADISTLEQTLSILNIDAPVNCPVSDEIE
jgi:hypothetical protein